ncbi:unnamed protein product [Malus baccata var. baccata]
MEQTGLGFFTQQRISVAEKCCTAPDSFCLNSLRSCKVMLQAVIVLLRSSNHKEHSFSKDLMEDTEITPISKLRPYIKAEKIKARVCRIWKSTILGTTQKYTCLHCILLDETLPASFPVFKQNSHLSGYFPAIFGNHWASK